MKLGHDMHSLFKIDMTEERNIVIAGVLMALATCVSTASIHYVLRIGKSYIDENRTNVDRNHAAIIKIEKILNEQDKKVEQNSDTLFKILDELRLKPP